MKSNSSWTTFLISSFIPFSTFAAKPTEQSTEESIKEPLLAKEKTSSAPIKEAPTVSGTNSGTQSTTLYSRLVGMFTSWTKEKEPSAQSAETSSPTPSVPGSSRSSSRVGSPTPSGPASPASSSRSSSGAGSPASSSRSSSLRNTSPTPSGPGSERSVSVTFGSESNSRIPGKPKDRLIELETKNKVKPPRMGGPHLMEEPHLMKKPPRMGGQPPKSNSGERVASGPPATITFSKTLGDPKAYTDEAQKLVKLAKNTNSKNGIELTNTNSLISMPSAEPSVFETFAQQFVEAKNNVQNTAGTVISEVSSNASVRTQSAVQDLTNLFENMGHTPAGSSAGIDPKPPTGPVNNSSIAPGSTPAKGPASSSSSSSRSSSRSSGSSQGSGSGSALSYYNSKMEYFNPQTGPRDPTEIELAEGKASQESQKALRDKLDAKSQAHLTAYQDGMQARNSMKDKVTIEASNKGLESAAGRGGPTVTNRRHKSQAEERGVIKAGEPHNRWATRVTSPGGAYGHAPSR